MTDRYRPPFPTVHVGCVGRARRPVHTPGESGVRTGFPRQELHGAPSDEQYSNALCHEDEAYEGRSAPIAKINQEKIENSKNGKKPMWPAGAVGPALIAHDACQ